MKEIKTSDYVSEYEFRRYDGPKYQASSLRPVIQERKKKPDNDDRVLGKRLTNVPEQRTRQSREDMQPGEEYARKGIGNGQKRTDQRISNDMWDEGDRNMSDLTGSKQDNFSSAIKY
ncbi:MAG: hypothetical protein IKN79_06725 [Eubacterium sp.]|nr:hypothetical protein [Eubacterium sp.]